MIYKHQLVNELKTLRTLIQWIADFWPLDPLDRETKSNESLLRVISSNLTKPIEKRPVELVCYRSGMSDTTIVIAPHERFEITPTSMVRCGEHVGMLEVRVVDRSTGKFKRSSGLFDQVYER